SASGRWASSWRSRGTCGPPTRGEPRSSPSTGTSSTRSGSSCSSSSTWWDADDLRERGGPPGHDPASRLHGGTAVHGARRVAAPRGAGHERHGERGGRRTVRRGRGRLVPRGPAARARGVRPARTGEGGRRRVAAHGAAAGGGRDPAPSPAPGRGLSLLDGGEGRHRGRHRDGRAGAAARAPRPRESLVHGQPARRRRLGDDEQRRTRDAERIQPAGGASGDRHPCGAVSPGRPPLRGAPADVPVASGLLGRAGCTAPMDRPPRLRARCHQSRARRAHRVGVVRRDADRLRPGRGAGGRALRTHPDLPAPAARRAGGHREGGPPVSVRGLAGAVLLVTVACDRLPGRPRPEDRPTRPSQVKDFATLYDHNCAGCHGTERRPGAAVALADPVYLALADDATIRRATAVGVPGTAMPAFARRAGGALTDEQVDVVVHGMRARWARAAALGGTAPPPYAATPGDAGRGAAAYATY